MAMTQEQINRYLYTELNKVAIDFLNKNNIERLDLRGVNITRDHLTAILSKNTTVIEVLTTVDFDRTDLDRFLQQNKPLRELQKQDVSPALLLRESRRVIAQRNPHLRQEHDELLKKAYSGKAPAKLPSLFHLAASTVRANREEFFAQSNSPSPSLFDLAAHVVRADADEFADSEVEQSCDEHLDASIKNKIKPIFKRPYQTNMTAQAVATDFF